MEMKIYNFYLYNIGPKAVFNQLIEMLTRSKMMSLMKIMNNF